MTTTLEGQRMWTTMYSPIGELRIVARDSAAGAGITAIEFEDHVCGPKAGVDWRPSGPRADDHPQLRDAVRQLREYFAGTRRDFDLPLAPEGTDFQRHVWQQLRGIGYGETASYGQIAARLGRTNAASRAVGLANGSNPIPIVVPCHRVIGANGTLVGYAGGVERKRYLLDLEQGALF